MARVRLMGHLRAASWVRPYLAMMVRMGGGAKFDAAVVQFVMTRGVETK